jgi:hypothetical protein
MLALALLAAPAPAQGLAPGRVVPLATRGEQCEFVLPTSQPGDKFVLVVGSLAAGPQAHRVTVHAEVTADPVSLPDVGPAADATWRERTNAAAGRLARARRARGSDDDYPPAADPPRRRVFHVFVGEHNFDDPAGYAAVTADLRAVGRHCQVYVDHAHADASALQPTVDEVVRVFDGAVEPAARRELGRCLDVDRDGRFTVLFSGVLGRMSGGRVALDGFVRGSDFDRDLPAPLGNRCDLMYLNTGLRPGPHLRTLLAHEYTHAVVFSERARAAGSARPPDEEAWLNEGLAHVVEECRGFGWSNLDHRVSAFLAAPERYRLVVPDYYASGLWRDPGCRGATFLFLRSCCERRPGLPAELVQSDLSGVANLEAATREPFADLFRRWTAAVALDPTRTLGGRLLCGPRTREVALSGGQSVADVAGTAAAYFLLHSPGGARSQVTVAADPGADLQVTLIPLSPSTPRLELRAERCGTSSYRLALTAHDAALTLESACWERAAPASGRPGETSFRPEDPGREARAWFGTTPLKPGETRTSPPIPLPPGPGPWLFKVAGREAAAQVTEYTSDRVTE